MALDDVKEAVDAGLDPLNNTFIQTLPSDILSKIEFAVVILKAAGLILIGYLIFLLIRSLYAWRRHRRIDSTYHTVNTIDGKLDILLENKGVKVKLLKDVDSLRTENEKLKAENEKLRKKQEAKEGFVHKIFKNKNETKK